MGKERVWDLACSLYLKGTYPEAAIEEALSFDKLFTEKTKPQKAAQGELSLGDLPLLAQIWNDNVTKLPKIKRCDGNRLKAARARYAAEADTAFWEAMVKKVNESDFCNGNNERKWVATFDWFIRPDTVQKVYEGKYDNRLPGAPVKPISIEELENL